MSKKEAKAEQIEQTALATPETNSLIESVDDEVKLTTDALGIPSYDDMTDARVLSAMRATFKGFENNADDDTFLGKFSTIEALSAFILEGRKELTQSSINFKRDSITNEGALMAKRWFYGRVISRCLENSKYGASAAGKLSKSSGYSIAAIYQYQTVGKNLTMKDCYVLGMYGVSFGLIRDIATLKDEADRKNLIKCYVDMVSQNFDNPVIKVQAMAALRNAIQQRKSGTVSLDEADLKRLETDEVEAAGDAYKDAMMALEKLEKSCAKFTGEKFLNELEIAFSNCYVMETVPAAEDRCAEIAGKVAAIKAKIKKMNANIEQLEVQLDSLARIQPTPEE